MRADYRPDLGELPDNEVADLLAHIRRLSDDLAATRKALVKIKVFVDNIRTCNGYYACDASGTENSAWLGPRLSDIFETARKALNDTERRTT